MLWRAVDHRNRARCARRDINNILPRLDDEERYVALCMLLARGNVPLAPTSRQCQLNDVIASTAA